MTIRVTGPEGVVVNFPDGTDPATMDRVMREAMEKVRGGRKLVPVTDPELLKQLNSGIPAPQPKLTPVTDPKLLEQLNAGQTRMIEIRGPDGSINRFPEGMPDEEIKRAMRKVFGGPPETQTAQDTSFGRGLKVGTQAVGKGLADIAGMPVDRPPWP